MCHPSFDPIDTEFKIVDEQRNTIVPTAATLMDQYLSESIMTTLVTNSNTYIELHKRKEPEAACWKDKDICALLDLSSMYHFIAILYYMGISRLPCKIDYWSAKKWMPYHPLVHELGMTRSRFLFIWRHFHVSAPSVNPNSIHTEAEEIDDSTVDDSPVEPSVERIVAHQERDLQQQNGEESEQSEDGRIANEEDIQVWFNKIKPLVDHFRNVTFSIVFILGTLLSFDEMMVRFMGRSGETHRIKNKPIGEGYKLFTLTTFRGFIVNFTLDGRTAATGKNKKGTQEYEMLRGSGKIHSMILHVTGVIDRFKERQLKRFQNHTRSTRNNNQPPLTEKKMSTFCIAMDNYFTLPGVMKTLREKNIGVVGTARFKQNWPPKELKVIEKSQAEFNDFFYTYDDHGTLIARWMDNGLVFLVSTIHSIGSIIQRNRRRPRITQNNKAHVSKVWGAAGVMKVYIPLLVDHYNHWMGGVDLSDQRIVYYMPDLRCVRNWIPLFIQLLSMIRNNSYLVHSDYHKNRAMRHKEFLYAMIEALLTKAHFHARHKLSRGGNRAANKRKHMEEAEVAVSQKSNKVGRHDKHNQHLHTSDFPQRFNTTLVHSIGKPTKGKKRGSCVVCASIYYEKVQACKAVGSEYNGDWKVEVTRP